MTIRVSDLDPFGGIGDELARDESLGKKMTHHWEEGQRVRLRPSGRTGKIKTINNRGDLNVMLDSGHFVQCMDTDDCEPEDWAGTAPEPAPPSMTASEKAFAKAHSPYGWLEDDEPSALDRKLEAAGGPFLAKSAELMESENVSDHDRVLIKTAMNNIQENRIATDPFGETEEHNAYILRIMAEKYAGASGGTGGDALHKAAGGDYVDELIKEAVDGLRAGHNIILPPECRIPMLRVPSLKTLVASGRICFDYAG